MRPGGGMSRSWRRFALGVSVRYWPCIAAPALEVYVGPFKAWVYVAFKVAK
jgi:hypothetical protein